MAAVATLAAVFSLAGCSGDDGDDGVAGAPGADGSPGTSCWDLNQNAVADPEEDINGDGSVDSMDCQATSAVASAKVEACATCHAGASEAHQSIYDQYTDESTLVMTFDDVASTDNGDGTFTMALDFTLTRDGAPYIDADGLPTMDTRSFNIVQYDSATSTFLNYQGLSAGGIVSNGDGTYTLTQADAPFAPEASSAVVYGYVGQGPLDIEDRQSGKRIRPLDNLTSAALEFGDVDTYVSAANVAGCVKCHGEPYLKHGQRAAVVAGLPDFVACKTCHYDDREGGHADWQLMVDDPVAWAAGEDASLNPDYAYRATVMNDVHMSHAMEFPYPMTMANCVTCHEGKIDQVLADENFTAETCKSCHVVEGVDAKPGETYYQANRAPPLEALWVPGIHTIDLPCQMCHAEGAGAATFADLHTGYDKAIYNAAGERYADLYTASIDTVTLDTNELTVEFSASDPAVLPEVSVSFYGWDSKDFLVSAHTRDANGVRMEYVPESSGGEPNALFAEAEGSAPGAWVVTLDLAAFQPANTASIPDLIAAGDVKRAEVMVTPELEVDGVDVGLDAVTRTVDLGTGAFVDDYFQDANAIAEVTKCNNCHDQLATTFHAGSGRGGSITACRVCHVTTSGGSHLEMQSRSLTSYAHAIHSFQAFDTGDIDMTDPVLKKRYELHIEHALPLFTSFACEGCHVAGAYDVPDQSKSMPALLSAADAWSVDRNIGSVPEYVTGPASMACGGCHRAAFINEDHAGELGSFNAHAEMGGTIVENDENDSVLYGVIDKIMTLFE
jgi:OmcA/MtrC family decaheme c-type cytochrome